MTKRPLLPSVHHAFRQSRGGFTLVELLVAIGIIVILIAILLPSIGMAIRNGKRVRMAADMQAIVVALEAYRQDHGDIPRVTGTTATVPTKTGDVILCMALVAPGPATGTGADGQDSFGFRTRQVVGTTPQGRAYGPYLDPQKFNLDLTDPANPRLLDSNKKPILYFSGYKKAPIQSPNGYVGPFAYNNTDPAAVKPMFNTSDNDMSLFDRGQTGTGLSKFRRIMGAAPNGAAVNPAYTGEYLLWAAGPDELFSLAADADPSTDNKCDDVANFSRGYY